MDQMMPNYTGVKVGLQGKFCCMEHLWWNLQSVENWGRRGYLKETPKQKLPRQWQWDLGYGLNIRLGRREACPYNVFFDNE